MPTFNPNEPQNGETVDADLLRNQLNALNNKIDAIPAPVAESDPIVGAVTGLVKADGAGHISAAIAGTDYIAPAGLIATGFGDARFNGTYIITGTWNTRPLFTNENGMVIFWAEWTPAWCMDTTAHSNPASEYYDPTSGWLPGTGFQWNNGGGGINPPGQLANGSAFATAAQGAKADSALQPVTTADGTYPIANDGVTSGQLTSLTISNGLITAVTVVP